MVHHVPGGMQEPSNPDKVVGIETSIGAVGYDGGEDEFPDAEAAAQISRSGTTEIMMALKFLR